VLPAYHFFSKFLFLLPWCKKTIRSATTRYSWFFLLLVIIGSAINDSAWIVKLTQLLFMPNADYRIILFWIRIKWGFQAVQYHATALFIESLVEKKYTLSSRQKIYCCFTACFVLFFIFMAFFNFNCFNSSDRPLFEVTVQRLEMLYFLFPLMLPSLFIAIKTIRSTTLPHIFEKTTKIINPSDYYPLLD